MLNVTHIIQLKTAVLEHCSTNCALSDWTCVVATRPPWKLKGVIMKECTSEGHHGIRAGCPLWRPCWTRVSLSGCFCGQEAPLGREPEGLNESSTQRH